MNCIKCGKEINDGSKFCPYCGASQEASQSSETFFRPAFQVEAAQRSAQILKVQEEFHSGSSNSGNYSAPKKPVERVEFNWDLSGLPTGEPTKTEPINFNWGSDVTASSKNYGYEPIPFQRIEREPNMMFRDAAAVERATAELELGELHKRAKGLANNYTEKPAEPVVTPKKEEPFAEVMKAAETMEGEKKLSIEELENEIFREMGSRKKVKEPTEAERIETSKYLERTIVAKHFDIPEEPAPMRFEPKPEEPAPMRFEPKPVEPAPMRFEPKPVEPAPAPEIKKIEIPDEVLRRPAEIDKMIEDFEADEAEFTKLEEAAKNIPKFKPPVYEYEKRGEQVVVEEQNVVEKEPDPRFFTYNEKIDAFDSLLKKAKPEGFVEKEKAAEKAQTYETAGPVIDVEATPVVEPAPIYIAPVVETKPEPAPEISESEIREAKRAASSSILDELFGAPMVDLNKKKEKATKTKEEVEIEQALEEPEEFIEPEPVKREAPKMDATMSTMVAADKEAQEEYIKSGFTEELMQIEDDIRDAAKKTQIDLDAVFGEIRPEVFDAPAPKRHKAGRIIITILIILLAIEATLVVVKLVAPDSIVSTKTDEIIVKVIDLFTKKS